MLESRRGRASFEVPYFEVPYLELVLKNIDFTIKNRLNLLVLEHRCCRAEIRPDLRNPPFSLTPQPHPLEGLK